MVIIQQQTEVAAAAPAAAAAAAAAAVGGSGSKRSGPEGPNRLVSCSFIRLFLTFPAHMSSYKPLHVTYQVCTEFQVSCVYCIIGSGDSLAHYFTGTPAAVVYVYTAYH